MVAERNCWTATEAFEDSRGSPPVSGITKQGEGCRFSQQYERRDRGGKQQRWLSHNGLPAAPPHRLQSWGKVRRIWTWKTLRLLWVFFADFHSLKTGPPSSIAHLSSLSLHNCPLFCFRGYFFPIPSPARPRLCYCVQGCGGSWEEGEK